MSGVLVTKGGVPVFELLGRGGPWLLDLFCCQGGAAAGYVAAGWDVLGVDADRNALRHYPFPAVHGDVFDVLDALTGAGLAGAFAAVHASPPCQAYSVTRHSHTKTHPQLIGPTRTALERWAGRTGGVWVMENVSGARPHMPDALTLCGTEFGLRATDTDGTLLRLERHRLFESNVFLWGAGGCAHDRRVQVGGVYGGGSTDRRHAKDVRRGGYTPGKPVARQLMGIDWMSFDGLAQAIPPAYTEFIGTQLLDHAPTRQHDLTGRAALGGAA